MTVKMLKLARPKLTGVPVKILSNVPVLADGKPIKNNMLKEILGGLPQFVGEVVVGKPEAPDCFDVSKAFVDDEFMINLFVFWVYDLKTTDNYDLQTRLSIAESFVPACGPNTQYVDHEMIASDSQLIDYKSRVFSRGFSGVILREPYGTFGTYDEEITPETAVA